MKSTLTQELQKRIAHKLVFWVIIFSALITLVVTAVQVYVDYRREIRGIKKYFESISFLQLDSLSYSVWMMDDRQVLALLEGIVQGPDVVYAAVIDKGKVVWSKGVENVSNALTTDYFLSHIHRSNVIDLGKLYVVADVDNVYARIIREIIAILSINLVKTLLFAGCILFFFQYEVTRHLEKLASHLISMDFRKKVLPLKLDRHYVGVEDEFSQVVNMLNIFQRRAHHAFNALGKSETRLRLFFDATEEGIFGINHEGRITFLNRACREKIGENAEEEVLGKRVDQLFFYIPQSRGEQNTSRKWSFFYSLQNGSSQSCDEGILSISQGKTFHASLRSYPLIESGKIVGAVFLFVDISKNIEMIREKNLLSHAGEAGSFDCCDLR